MPDFESIAKQAALEIMRREINLPLIGTQERIASIIAEQLRQVWNARGAADIARLEALEVMVSGDTLRSLDR